MLTLFTLTPSHTFLLGFPLDFGSSLIARTLSLSFLCCKIDHIFGGTTFGLEFHFHFTNVTRIELFSFVLVCSCCKHEKCRAENFWNSQEDDEVGLIPFIG